MIEEGREMRSELGRWWIYVLALVVVSMPVLAVLNYAGVIGDTVVERVVFENSFQYSEARKSEIATYSAQLAEIDAQLANPSLDDQTRNALMAQRSAINVRLSTARRKGN